MSRTAINILWFKRDLRLEDHAALCAAVDQCLPILALYLKEPTQWEQPQHTPRQWQFVWDSIESLNHTLEKTAVHAIQAEALDFFAAVQDHYDIKGVFSHEEIGIQWTYDRDKAVKQWFQSHGIDWHEYPTFGVARGLKNRRHWLKNWYAEIHAPAPRSPRDAFSSLCLPNPFPHWSATAPELPPNYFQRGGLIRSEKVLQSFLLERITSYAKSISKPRESRKGCSRISPHLAWGNLSVRQVFQRSRDLEVPGSKRNLKAFQDRLRWQSHFMQKFESEVEYEHIPINRAFVPVDASKEMDTHKFQAWKDGLTGVPLVDACMRCLTQTGYLNFRMRAMVVSFYSQYLWLPFKPGADYLAGLFTDFEPGIHYPQFQMQSGYTGVNTIRIYNPIKQSQDHDPKGVFIKEWIPELRDIPEEYIHEPWKIPPMQWAMEGWQTGNYPREPIVNLQRARKHASDLLYSTKKSKNSRIESVRILERHTNPGRKEI